MRNAVRIGLALSVLLVAAGCDKTVKLTFFNRSSESLDLRVTPPGQTPVDLGTLAARGGVIRYEVKVKEEDLPARCFWKAGHHSGEILISKASPGVIPIEIRTGGPGDQRDVVKKKTHVDVEDKMVDEGLIVE